MRQRQLEDEIVALLLDLLRLADKHHLAGIALPVQLIGQRAQRCKADHLLAAPSAVQNRQRVEIALDFCQIAGLNLLKLTQIWIAARRADGCSESPDSLRVISPLRSDARQNAIHHHPIHGTSEKGQVGNGPRTLLDDHLFRVDHHPIAGGLGIAEDPLQRLDVIHQFGQTGQRVLIRHQPPQQPTGQADGGVAPAEEAVDIPLEALRHGQKTHRLAGRRGVDDHPVVFSGGGVAVDMQQAEDLLHSRNDRHLFRNRSAHALLAQNLAHVALQLAPVFAHLVQDVDLLRKQIGCHLRRFALQRRIQAVGQAVSDVCADDKRAAAHLRAA